MRSNRRLKMALLVPVLLLMAAPGSHCAQPSCDVAEGRSFPGADLLCQDGKPCPRRSVNAGHCCGMCATKPYYEEPVGQCSAWSFDHAHEACWMKSHNSTRTDNRSFTSGIVISRGGDIVNASCSAVLRAERRACPDPDVESSSVGAAQCAALGCCFDPSEGQATSPPCFYFSEAKGARPPCSLNGVNIPASSARTPLSQKAAGCTCDPGWDGDNCERLKLKPAVLSNGYNSWSTAQPGTSSWGATQLKGDDGRYHTWVDEMTRQCGINGYENNMQIVHYTSEQPLGGWVRQSPVSNVTSICAHAVRDPASKKYLIFHTGCGDDSNPNSHGFPLPTRTEITNCANGSTPLCTGHPNTTKCRFAPGPPPAPRPPPGPAPIPTCGIASNTMSIFVSDSPDGPWTQQMPTVLQGSGAQTVNGVPWAADGAGFEMHFIGGNPTALIFPNGTTLVMFRGGADNHTQCRRLGVVVRSEDEDNHYPGCTVVGLARADHWSGPYSIVGGPAIPFQQEDFFIYQNKRGFHALFHGMDPWPGDITGGRHAYSEDGLTWFGGDLNAFNGTVQLEGGRAMELVRRERPELLHDDETGLPVALISGVQGPAGAGGWTGDQTFTLVQEVDTARA